MNMFLSPYPGLILGLTLFLFAILCFDRSINQIIFYNFTLKNHHKFINNPFFCVIIGFLLSVPSFLLIINNVSISFDNNDQTPFWITSCFVLIIGIVEPVHKRYCGVYFFDFFGTIKLRMDSPFDFRKDDFLHRNNLIKDILKPENKLLRIKLSSDVLKEIRDLENIIGEINDELLTKIIDDLNRMIDSEDFYRAKYIFEKKKPESSEDSVIEDEYKKIFKEWQNRPVWRKFYNHLYIKKILSDALNEGKFKVSRYNSINNVSFLQIFLSLAMFFWIYVILFFIPNRIAKKIDKQNGKNKSGFSENMTCSYLDFYKHNSSTEKRLALDELKRTLRQKSSIIFVYGKAGTGKSTLVGQILKNTKYFPKKRVILLNAKNLVKDNHKNYKHMIINGIFKEYLESPIEFNVNLREIIRTFRDKDVIIIIDGLDEINVSSSQSDLINDMLCFIDKDKKKEMNIHFDTTFLITSRISEKRYIDGIISGKKGSYNLYCYKISDLTCNQVNNLFREKITNNIAKFRNNINRKFLSRINYKNRKADFGAINEKQVYNMLEIFLAYYYDLNLADNKTASYKALTTFTDVEITYNLFESACLKSMFIGYCNLMLYNLDSSLYLPEKIIQFFTYINNRRYLILCLLNGNVFSDLHLEYGKYTSGRTELIRSFIGMKIQRALKDKPVAAKNMDEIFTMIQEGNRKHTIELKKDNIYPHRTEGYRAC